MGTEIRKYFEGRSFFSSTCDILINSTFVCFLWSLRICGPGEEEQTVTSVSLHGRWDGGRC